MLDLKIDLLRLNVGDAEGQEQRLGRIAERAVSLFADRLATQGHASPRPGRPADSRHVSADDVKLDLDAMSDEEAADRLAVSLMGAIRMNISI